MSLKPGSCTMEVLRIDHHQKKKKNAYKCYYRIKVISVNKLLIIIYKHESVRP